MFYIQRKDSQSLETIDQFSSFSEAMMMLVEYKLADHSARHYVSRRPCKSWQASQAVLA